MFTNQIKSVGTFECDQTKLIVTWFSRFVSNTGMRLINTSLVSTKNNKPDPVALQSLPTRLLEMVNAFKHIVTTCFNRHKSFERGMTQGLVAIVNQNDYVAKLLVQ